MIPQIPGVALYGDDAVKKKREVQLLLKRDRDSFPGAQPVSFAYHHLEALVNEEFAGTVIV